MGVLTIIIKNKNYVRKKNNTVKREISQKFDFHLEPEQRI